jgi:hypothetical protein
VGLVGVKKVKERETNENQQKKGKMSLLFLSFSFLVAINLTTKFILHNMLFLKT